jgi:hypothetical protein
MKKNHPIRKTVFRRTRVNAKPSERGLGPDGGGWNISQASSWSGIGSANLREMAKRRIETGDPSLFPCYLIGLRRILIPRQGFIDWFNGRAAQAGPSITQGRVA